MALSGVAWTVEGMVEMEDALRRIFLLFLVVAGRKETRREETRGEATKVIVAAAQTMAFTNSDKAATIILRAGVLVGCVY